MSFATGNGSGTMCNPHRVEDLRAQLLSAVLSLPQTWWQKQCYETVGMREIANLPPMFGVCEVPPVVLPDLVAKAECACKATGRDEPAAERPSTSREARRPGSRNGRESATYIDPLSDSRGQIVSSSGREVDAAVRSALRRQEREREQVRTATQFLRREDSGRFAPRTGGRRLSREEARAVLSRAERGGRTTTPNTAFGGGYGSSGQYGLTAPVGYAWPGYQPPGTYGYSLGRLGATSYNSPAEEAAAIAEGLLGGQDGPPLQGGKAPPQGSGWPGAASFRPGNWNFDTCVYSIAPGDTLSGLAATYLGAPDRWKEIWDYQPQEVRWNYSPDTGKHKTTGQYLKTLVMPPEACDKAKTMLKNDVPAAPSTVGKKTPGKKIPGEDPNAPDVEGLGLSTAAKVGIGVAAAAVVGGIIWAAS